MEKRKQPLTVDELLLEEYEAYLKMLNRQRALDDQFLKNFIEDDKLKKARGGTVKMPTKSSNFDKAMYFDSNAKSRILRDILKTRLNFKSGGLTKKQIEDRIIFLNKELEELSIFTGASPLASQIATELEYLSKLLEDKK